MAEFLLSFLGWKVESLGRLLKNRDFFDCKILLKFHVISWYDFALNRYCCAEKFVESALLMLAFFLTFFRMVAWTH